MKTLKNKFLLAIFFMATVALPAINAFQAQHSNLFHLLTYDTDATNAKAAIVFDTLVGIGAATIFCGVQAAVAIGFAG